MCILLNVIHSMSVEASTWASTIQNCHRRRPPLDRILWRKWRITEYEYGCLSFRAYVSARLLLWRTRWHLLAIAVEIGTVRSIRCGIPRDTNAAFLLGFNFSRLPYILFYFMISIEISHLASLIYMPTIMFIRGIQPALRRNYTVLVRYRCLLSFTQEGCQ